MTVLSPDLLEEQREGEKEHPRSPGGPPCTSTLLAPSSRSKIHLVLGGRVIRGADRITQCAAFLLISALR